jgi:hypothetical protein
MDVSRETSILFSTGKFPETPLSGGGIPLKNPGFLPNIPCKEPMEWSII